MTKNAQVSRGNRLARVVVAALTAAVLAACGGGGSGNTVVSKPGVSLFTNAGSSVTVSAGSTAEYTIGGGGGGSTFVSYNASTNDTKVATVTVSGSSLKITGVNPGDASVIVTDSSGASVAIAVKVPASALAKVEINAPTKITLTPGITSQYKVTGGKAPYRVAVSAPNVVAAAAGMDAVSITAANPGTATVIVYDALGNSDSFDITVTGGSNVTLPLYTTAPDTLRMSGKATSEYTVNGGTAPYVVTSTDAAVVTGAISGNKLTITTGSAGRGILNIRDSAGILIVVTVNILGDYVAPLYTTAPTGVTLAAGSQATYTVNGGSAPYIASTSNADVAHASVLEGNQLVISGVTAGLADVFVFDASGSSVKVSATVGGGTGKVPLYTTAPDAITVLVGATPTYQIAGGAAPYTVTSSNVEVATVSQSASAFTVTGNKVGKAVIAIRDANGSAVNIGVEVK